MYIYIVIGGGTDLDTVRHTHTHCTLFPHSFLSIQFRLSGILMSAYSPINQTAFTHLTELSWGGHELTERYTGHKHRTQLSHTVHSVAMLPYCLPCHLAAILVKLRPEESPTFRPKFPPLQAGLLLARESQLGEAAPMAVGGTYGFFEVKARVTPSHWRKLCDFLRCLTSRSSAWEGQVPTLLIIRDNYRVKVEVKIRLKSATTLLWYFIAGLWT